MPALVDRFPHVEPQRLIAELVPPPRFATESFATYLPDPAQPTQAAAVAGLQAFAAQLETPPPASGSSWFRFRRAAAPPERRAGIYLDGGFGVGKTHLLASLWHVAPEPRAFGTFVEFTHLVGALGFASTVEALSGHRLVCIDEFELDDPGDTVLMSTLLNRLVDAGVRLAATSNTLPDRLGEGRFAADDFLREIQGLAAHFDVYRIDGEDYRHRGLPTPPEPLPEAEVIAAAHQGGGHLDAFSDLMAHLARVHPSRYGALLDGVRRVHLTGVTQLHDQAAALRLVVLADRLYDRDVPVVASGVPLDRVFGPEMLRGGYRKKYYRAISRLVALAREGAGLAE
ncbi:MAG: cell division protein ZapE [Candidatus Nanopelagicales bacterium]|jgi:cell division protein ZapE|nr:cell division protein ZapE [Candidatus Nanopelagicales bacterium]MCU0937446.1 cell division protein ZapE [Gammaproteobacteria bacterium]